MADVPMPPAGESRRTGVVLVELVRIVIVAAFTAVGYQLARAMVSDPASPAVAIGALLGSSVGYVSGGVLGRAVRKAAGAAEVRLTAMDGADLVSGGTGLVGGVMIGTAIGLPLLLLPYRAIALPTLAFVQIVVGYLGYRIGITKREDLLQLFGLSYRTRASDLRVLDTSGLLNPQLIDFVRAGLLRGTIVVPVFVLEEAQGIADSADTVRRQRARLGLDALAAIKREGLIEVRPEDRRYPEYDEVDAKLIALARDRGASVVTDDTNLARVAELQGVETINLRRLSATLRPAALPGEIVALTLSRKGSEPGQGVGYLDDGTMVVVEGAATSVGRPVRAVVRRLVHTTGGHMIFAGLEGADEGREDG